MTRGISQLVLKVAELCNLNCSYCYLYQHEDQGWRLRPKFMTDEVFEQLLVRVREYCERRAPHQMTLIFHGGEPTLAGPERIEGFAQSARRELGEHLGGIAIQTNGTLIDERWVEVIARNGIQPGVSLDGPQAAHDANRVDHGGRGSYTKVVEGLRLLQESGLAPSVLCVVNPAARGGEVYRAFRALGVRRFDFLLPDVTYDSKLRFFPGYEGTPLADYLIEVFDEWFAEDDPEVKVRLFWGFISTLLGGSTETDQFGNPLTGYLVIETDGSIHANDVFRICAEGMADGGLDVFRHSFEHLAQALPLLNRVIHEGIPLSATCEACSEREICGGGYIPHRYAQANGFDNPSVWCEDIQRVLTHIRARVGGVCLA